MNKKNPIPMACNNCHLFTHHCMANCCGPVPIDNEVFEANKHLIPESQEYRKIVFSEKQVIATSMRNDKYKGEKCAFLGDDYKCRIYDSRPEICQKFGDGSHIMLMCSWQMPDGEARPFFGRERLQKDQERYMKNRNNNLNKA